MPVQSNPLPKTPDALEPPPATELPWQLQMYRKSLKKRQKVDLLMRLMGQPHGARCLLISGHDNNGAMNHEFRAAAFLQSSRSRGLLWLSQHPAGQRGAPRSHSARRRPFHTDNGQ